ncbi:hypothetical protein PENCOP_c006G07555 [Penicillium coprophilum]|uniref:Uncharacterized protein n=1 Tax=Penicillium coprophilum TaxID=36646 RepID=A0A1V6UN52_9EURO|nr:hypothetical protein PENCOP_c006G07555 [Penicillium coprophilum]
MADEDQSPFPNEVYTVGWICALAVEFAAAIGMLDEEHGSPQKPPSEADSNSYALGSIGKFKVVIACLPLDQQGAVSAATCAKEMVFTFPKVRIGLLVGIGAGIPGVSGDPDIRLGDIVVSSSKESGGVVVYDFGKQLADGSFKCLSILNRPPRVLTAALAKLKARHLMHGSLVPGLLDQMLQRFPGMRNNGYTYPGTSSDLLFSPEYFHVGGKTCEKCNASNQVEREIRSEVAPKIHYGTIASGNIVIKDPINRDRIRENHGAICLEMEAAGLMNDFPCLVIRGISDYADSHKNDHWQPFAAAAAAAYAKEFLGCVQARDVDEAVPATEIISKVHEEVMEIRNIVTLEQYQDILEWLTPLNPDKLQNTLLEKRASGSGSWFLESKEFTEWISQPKQTLVCPGIPGAGKSVLSAIVVEELKSKCQEDKEIQICAIFCSYQTTPRESVLDILLSLLRQLAVKGGSLHPSIRKMHEHHQKWRTRPSMQEIKEEIGNIAQQHKMVFLVIDAIDEYCSSSAEELQDLLKTLFELQKKAPINILATSRPHSQILAKFDALSNGYVTKEIRAKNADIEIYLKERMANAAQGYALSQPDVQGDVLREVTNNIDGMFLLARLHMNHLMATVLVGALRNDLKKLPQGGNKLEEAYKTTISRIKANRGLGDQYELAVRILSWLAYSRRALYAKELQHALSTDPERSELSQDHLMSIDLVDSLCAGLVEYDRNTGIVRLIHYTAKEYLIGHEILQNAEMEIAKASITYLSFSCFASGRSTRPEQYTFRQEKYALHHYSASHWASHALAALGSSNSAKTLDFFSGFLDKEYNVYAAGQAMMSHSVHGDEKPTFSNWLDFIPRRLTKAHLVAYGGLTPILSRYIISGDDLNARDSDGMTPLAYATQNGHLEAVKLLLQSRDTFPDVMNNHGGTPLLIAAFQGHTEIAQLLMQYGANPHTKYDDGCSTLCGAAQSGSIQLMQLFLDKGVDINSRCSYDSIDDQTALSHAFSNNSTEALQFLLSKGADPDIQDEFGNTLLCDAARAGDEALATDLIHRGVRVNIKGNLGSTPLHYAIEGGSINIVKLLLDVGAKLNAQDNSLDTPLAIAVRYGFEEAALYLLQRGADANVKNKEAEAALFHAIKKGYTQVAIALLKHGANPNLVNHQHESPLFVAASHSAELVNCLRRHGADPGLKNKNMQNALFSAAREGDGSTIDKLTDMGLDVNEKDDQGNTPLFYAAESGNRDAIKSLLAKGASVNQRNLHQETALFFAARLGRFPIVQILLEHDADPDPESIDAETPLLCAAKGLCPSYPKAKDWNPTENSKVVRLLLDLNANVNPQRSLADQHPSPKNELLAPVFYAVKGGHSALVKDLLRKGTQVDLSPKQIQLVLQEAVRSGHLQIVEMVLGEGPVALIENADIPSLVTLAAGTGKKDILEFLLQDRSVTLDTKREALLSAISNQQVEIATILLGQGATPDLVNEKAQSALHLSVFCKDLGLVSLLLEKNMKVDSKDNHGRTPLFYAVQRRELNIARALLDAGANPNTTEAGYSKPLRYKEKDFTGKFKDLEARNLADCFGDTTPLFYAAGDGNDSMVDLLLNHPKSKAFPDPQDQFGERPISWAAGKGYEAIVKMLLDKGANPNQPDDPSRSPIFWALKSHDKSLHQKIVRGRGLGSWDNYAVGDMSAMVDLLLQYGADPNVADGKGRTPISLLVEFDVNSKRIVSSLLGAGCNPNVKDRYGRTPLMGAVVRDLGDFVDALREHPSLDRDATDNFGRTAITEAISRKKPGFLLLLDPERFRSMVRVNGKELPADAELVVFQQRDGGGTHQAPRGPVDTHTELNFADPSQRGTRDVSIAMVDGSDTGVICDICGARIPREATLNCRICNDGDFDLCADCKEVGAACFDEEHELVAREPLKNRGSLFFISSDFHGYDE